MQYHTLSSKYKIQHGHAVALTLGKFFDIITQIQQK